MKNNNKIQGFDYIKISSIVASLSSLSASVECKFAGINFLWWTYRIWIFGGVVFHNIWLFNIIF